jgi:hypothetical protein
LSSSQEYGSVTLFSRGLVVGYVIHRDRPECFYRWSLCGVRREDAWEGKDQNYVSLVEGSSQPYKTQFMNTALQGIFCLNYNRLGVFTNIGDRAELDQSMIKNTWTIKGW